MPANREATESSPNGPGLLRIQLLGGFRVVIESRLIDDAAWQRRKVRALIKLLALAPGHRLHRDALYETLWPELDRTSADNNLRRALHIARHVLEPHAVPPFRYLSVIGDQVALCPTVPFWVDVEAFEAAVTAASRSGDPAAYEAAAALYIGELLPEDPFEEWSADHRHTLRVTYLDLLLELSQLREERRELEPAIDALRRLVATEPAHEEGQVRLMRLYALTGRRQLALQEYARLRDALQRELDAQPLPTTTRLYEDIRSGCFRDKSGGDPGRSNSDDWFSALA